MNFNTLLIVFGLVFLAHGINRVLTVISDRDVRLLVEIGAGPASDCMDSGKVLITENSTGRPVACIDRTRFEIHQ